MYGWMDQWMDGRKEDREGKGVGKKGEERKKKKERKRKETKGKERENI